MKLKPCEICTRGTHVLTEHRLKLRLGSVSTDIRVKICPACVDDIKHNRMKALVRMVRTD